MRPLLPIALLLTACTLAFAACDKSERDSGATSAPDDPPLATGLLRAAPSTVCMVNDRYMGKDQIPVPVGGKTYFGCCAGCKDRLEREAAVRTGTDPVSGNPVDKATAVIARNESGKVFYFENEGTLRRYRP